MSKPTLKILRLVVVFSAIALTTVGATAQSLKATVSIDNVRGAAVVRGEFADNTGAGSVPVTKLSFLRQAIGVPSLGSRMSNIEVFGENGRKLAYRRPNESEFVLESSKNTDVKTITSFSYELDLRPVADRRSAAHSSWVTPESGLLLFDDILPLRSSVKPRNVFLKLELPTGWSAATTVKDVHGTIVLGYASEDAALIGPQIRQRSDKGTTIATGDTWQFSDEKALTAATEVAEAYRKVFDSYPSTGRQVLLVRFPQRDVPKGTWEAETRSNTVILVSSDMAFESQALQRLREQLRHELFHLWFPNAVNLTGRYDWFYEGFALYQSLKTGVLLNQITFADFLDTLSRAHAIDSAGAGGRLSLLEASAARWAGNETQVYARGMVTAFICDLVLMRESNGKRSVETLFRQLFASRRYDAMPEDGNTVVLRLLDSYAELNPIVTDYIRGNRRFDWAGVISAAGLENESGSPGARLRVASKLTGKQKTMLDKLGYNSWRKLTRK